MAPPPPPPPPPLHIDILERIDHFVHVMNAVALVITFTGVIYYLGFWVASIGSMAHHLQTCDT